MNLYPFFFFSLEYKWASKKMNKPKQDETNILLGEKVTHRDTETHTFARIEIPLKHKTRNYNIHTKTFIGGKNE